MRKLFIVLLVLLPIIVFAEVDENTLTTNWEVASESNAFDLCMNEENKNNAGELSSATTGYYLYCVKINCNNSVNVHQIDHPLRSVLHCANGNPNPKTIISSSGASGEELKNGAACITSGIYAYATEKVYYNCSLTAAGEAYTPATSAPTTTNVPTTTVLTTTTKAPEETTTTSKSSTTSTVINETTTAKTPTTTVKSPDTGVEDYFLTLGGVVALLIVGLYIIDKKNIFKKI